LSEILRIPLDRELRIRVRWLIALRWAAIGVAVALTLLATRRFGNALPLGSLWTTVGAIAVYNLAFWFVTHRLVSPMASDETQAALMHGQVLADLLALTTMLHFSGGIENPFATMYALLVVVGSILTTKRSSYVYASVATVLWVGLLLGESSGLLPHYNLEGFRLATRYRETAHIIAEGLVLAGANFAIAFFASSIMERLRQEERRLYDAHNASRTRVGELAQLNERLREYDQVRSFFTRLVTHELRAPVAAIQSYLRLILDGYVSQERVYEIVGKAEQRSRDQLELISDLLELARVQEVKEDVDRGPTDAARILRDVLDMMQAEIQDKSLSLSIDVASGVQEVQVGEDHVKRVWTNLISNAIKYTPPQGSITITLHDENGMVRGTVRDTGIGIKPEDLERIFETFYRSDEAKAMARHGTGLGLSIVRGITERYGGRVWVESRVGEGSTFYFELPAAG